MFFFVFNRLISDKKTLLIKITHYYLSRFLTFDTHMTLMDTFQPVGGSKAEICLPARYM